MKTLRIRLDLAPFANLETRATKDGVMYTPKAKKDFMLAVRQELLPYKYAFHEDRFLRLHFVFVCDRPHISPDGIPSAIYKNQVNFYKPTRPDCDNYLKPLQDSMGYSVLKRIKNKHGEVTKEIRGAKVIDDDSFIVSLTVDKILRRPSQSEHVLITIQKLNSPIFDYDSLYAKFTGYHDAELPSSRHTLSQPYLLL